MKVIGIHPCNKTNNISVSGFRHDYSHLIADKVPLQ